MMIYFYRFFFRFPDFFFLNFHHIKGGDVKLALISNLHNFLINLNLAAKSYQNIHLKILNNFHKKEVLKIQPQKNIRGERAKFCRFEQFGLF